MDRLNNLFIYRLTKHSSLFPILQAQETLQLVP